MGKNVSKCYISVIAAINPNYIETKLIVQEEMVILENEKKQYESDLGVYMYLGVTPPQVEIKKNQGRMQGLRNIVRQLNFYYVS